MNILQEIKNIGIIPVVCINDPAQALPLGKALIDGGLPAAEITFRTAAAEESIKLMSDAYPEILVGAGTVLTIEQAEKAVNAGAKFIVSPGLNAKVVSWCKEHNVPVLPGCTTPTEIETAIELGLDTVKFFPAEQSGGIAKIKAMAAPYTNMKFMPTGGISLDNMNDYLAFGKIIACGGSFMVKGELLEKGDWQTITDICKKTVRGLLGLRLAHIGINEANEGSALSTAHMIAELMGCEINEKGLGIFAGNSFEIMKSPGRGKNGHIAISTNNVERAIYHLSKRGIKFDQSSARFDEKGNIQYIYIDADFGGFAIHLTLKP